MSPVDDEKQIDLFPPVSALRFAAGVFACPLSQYMLADALGLTAVHINLIMRQLREERLLTFRSGQVIFDVLEAHVTGRFRYGLSRSGRSAAEVSPEAHNF